MANEISIEEIKGIVCAWKGCDRHTISIDPNIKPAGWKNILVLSGSAFKKKNILRADIDGVLCPEHFKELWSLLKIGRVKKTGKSEIELRP